MPVLGAVPRTRRPASGRPRRRRPYGVRVNHAPVSDPATPHPITAGQPGHGGVARGRSHRRAPLLAGLLAGLLIGCGSPARESVGTVAEPEPPPAAAPAAPSTGTVTPVPDPDPSTAAAPDEAVRLPWPAAEPGAVAALQRSVDAGAEPWLLDPAEVAVSYAAAAHGWNQAEARPRPGGRTVEVADGGRRMTLSLSQPGRIGGGGIWVVTAEAAG